MHNFSKLLNITTSLLNVGAWANCCPEKREIKPVVSGQVYLTSAQLARMLCVSRTSLWRRIKDDKAFPKPVRFGKAMRRWSLPEIETYLAASRA